jgi:hypothetical protein
MEVPDMVAVPPLLYLDTMRTQMSRQEPWLLQEASRFEQSVAATVTMPLLLPAPTHAHGRQARHYPLQEASPCRSPHDRHATYMVRRSSLRVPLSGTAGDTSACSRPDFRRERG